MAWEGCKAVYISFDIDSIDPGFAPGTGSPEPGGLMPREAFEMIHTIAKEGLCGMEVVEVSTPYDVNDNTAQLACRVVLDTIGTLVAEGHLQEGDEAGGVISSYAAHVIGRATAASLLGRHWTLGDEMLATLVLGLLLGMQHAMEADHVAAVASLASGHGKPRNFILHGASWGLGHGVMLLLVGGAIILSHGMIDPSLTVWLDFAVGGMLVGLGS